MDRFIARWLNPEITDLKDKQQRCLSRIDDLEDQHQTDPSTHSDRQPDIWNQMRNKVYDETRKEIDYLNTKQQEDTAIHTEFKALKSAKENDTLPADGWREKLTDIAKRQEELEDSLRQRKRLVLDISENGRIGVTCTREDGSDWPLLMWRLESYSIQAELHRAEIETSWGSILDRQTDCFKFLNLQKENELNKIENNYNLSKREIENKFYSQISFVKEQASCELELIQPHRLKLQDLEKRTDFFKKRLGMLYANDKAMLSPSYEATLQKEAESLKKEWDTLLAYKVQYIFDLKFEMTCGVLRVTCTSSNGTAVCPGNTKKGKGKRQKTNNNRAVLV